MENHMPCGNPAISKIRNMHISYLIKKQAKETQFNFVLYHPSLQPRVAGFQKGNHILVCISHFFVQGKQTASTAVIIL